MPADRIDPLPRLAAGVSLAPVVQPLRAPGAQRCAPSFTPQGTDSEELTGSRRAPARGGFLLGAEHGAVAAPTTHSSPSTLTTIPQFLRAPGASPDSGGSIIGAAILIAAFLAMALFGGCEHPLRSSEHFDVQLLHGRSWPHNGSCYFLTDKRTGATYVVREGGTVTPLPVPATAEGR